MVAKISVGNSLYGSLVYNGEKINKEKGKVLATNKIYNDGSGTINIHRAFEDFKMWVPQSTKAEKPMMHISLNPHPDDRLSDAEYAQLAHEYMEKMGFGDMPFIIVKHEDIDRHHIHIVALRVRPDGTAISTKNNFYKSKEITRELERKYGLHAAERQKITPDMPITKVDPNGDVKRQVAMAVKMVGMRYKFQTLGEYNAILSLYNIRCEEADGRYNGREYHGLVYFAMDDNGKTISTPLKASRLGKFAGREAIDQRYQKAKEKIDVRPTKRKVAAVMAQSSGKDDFIARLKTENIDLVLRYTDDGRIYGATYIDHNTRTVLNGSRLGKEFSANALEKWFNNPAEKPIVQTHSNTKDNGTAPDNSQHQYQHQGGDSQSDGTASDNQSNRHGHTAQSTSAQSQSHGYDDTSMFEGLGGLFSVGPAFDAQEEAFYREMQRRKKKKRRGPKL
ncbi:conjugal transfer protein MobB [uncultured Duncaniella sp.]|uniref:conjugal transfer protein MobB n=1 Tax=uncultured Duncaniella sp. TaxID=2768039 RepID=UPI0025B32CDB|nr:conjugal transfer protein MobB [uncultured Duncaniella sp.]